MIKSCFFAIALFIGIGLSAQESEVFKFPTEAELITAISCSQEQDQNACTNSLIESRIKSILEKYQRKIKRDTLKFSVELSVNPNGEIKKKRFFFALKNDAVKKKINELLDNALSQESFHVTHYNDGIYPSSHKFNYRFLLQSKSKAIKSLPVAETYSGGIVQLIPLFPNSPRRGDELDRQGFQENMQNHIRKHFRYPAKALERGIQGVVYMIFTIDKRGRVTNLKMQSPHPVLSTEAKRIISLLPVFQPGIQDGKLAEVPYSIPISFRLY